MAYPLSLLCAMALQLCRTNIYVATCHAILSCAAVELLYHCWCAACCTAPFPLSCTRLSRLHAINSINTAQAEVRSHATLCICPIAESRSVALEGAHTIPKFGPASDGSDAAGLDAYRPAVFTLQCRFSTKQTSSLTHLLILKRAARSPLGPSFMAYY